MNPRRMMLELRKTWPHTLEIRQYSQRSKAGEFPPIGGLMALGVEFGTWRKDRRGGRIFGFKTPEARAEFKKKLGIELTLEDHKQLTKIRVAAQLERPHASRKELPDY